MDLWIYKTTLPPCVFIWYCSCLEVNHTYFWLLIYSFLFFFFNFSWCCLVSKSCPTLCNSMDCGTPDFPDLHYLQSLLRFMSTKSVMLSNHLIICHPFSFCLQSFPASGSFPMNRPFKSGGQSTGASTSASVLPVNIQGWFPLGWLVGSPCSPRDSQESSPTPQFESKVLQCSAFFMVQLTHPPMTTGKTIALTRWTFVNKIMSVF